MDTKNLSINNNDDLRPEYDLSKLRGGIRGKYYKRATVGTTLVLLEPDVAEAFPDGESVNRALRALVSIARICVSPSQASNSLPTPRRPTNHVKNSGKKNRTTRAARG